jgi:hypothetical protein
MNDREQKKISEHAHHALENVPSTFARDIDSPICRSLLRRPPNSLSCKTPEGE